MKIKRHSLLLVCIVAVIKVSLGQSDTCTKMCNTTVYNCEICYLKCSQANNPGQYDISIDSCQASVCESRNIIDSMQTRSICVNKREDGTYSPISIQESDYCMAVCCPNQHRDLTEQNFDSCFKQKRMSPNLKIAIFFSCLGGIGIILLTVVVFLQRRKRALNNQQVLSSVVPVVPAVMNVQIFPVEHAAGNEQIMTDFNSNGIENQHDLLAAGKMGTQKSNDALQSY